MLREESREALSWIADAKAAAVLEFTLTKTSDKREKRCLVDALGTRKSATSVPVLAPLMVDADVDLARASIDAVARIGGAPAVTALAAADAGGKLAPALKPEVERALLAASAGDAGAAGRIYQSTASDQVRLAAFIALMKSGPASGRPPPPSRNSTRTWFPSVRALPNGSTPRKPSLW